VRPSLDCARGRWQQRQQEYDDIPGAFVFDAERSRQGYGINMFCMSLLQKEKAL
jgi:hypothetical protein